MKYFNDQKVLDMNDWTDGYVSYIGYTYGYYSELNPQRVKLAFLSQGLLAPEFGSACELGFGQGVSANMHAAASVCSWHGTDFNPAQASFAQELAKVSGNGAQLFDESFAEFSNRELPDFDYIGLHGIWSWISDENRSVIVDFIRKKLKVAGVLYISYNTMPGWAAFAPMRHLLTEHAKANGQEGAGIVNHINDSLDFANKLLTTKPLFAQANPLVVDKIKEIKDENRHYLAHEYYNRDWHPMHFAKMSEWLSPAKLTFACSAHYFDHVDSINLTLEQRAFLDEIQDPIFKQTVRDFMVNQQFRKDYWVKGLRKTSLFERAELLRTERFVLCAYRPEVALEVVGSQGNASLTEAIYAPVLDYMADYKLRTLGQIESAVEHHVITFAQLFQVVLVLCGNGTLSFVQSDSTIAEAKRSTDNLNRSLMLKARINSDVSYLASPVTGGGLSINRFNQLFTLAMQHGSNKPEEWASFVSQLLNAQNQKILKEGVPIVNVDDQLAELTIQANEFALKKLPILKALQIT
jgi:hypothetical protein